MSNEIKMVCFSEHRTIDGTVNIRLNPTKSMQQGWIEVSIGGPLAKKIKVGDQLTMVLKKNA